MGLLKRIYLFYKNVMDIYNIDFVTIHKVPFNHIYVSMLYIYWSCNI